MFETCVVCEDLCTPWIWLTSVQGHVCEDCAADLRDEELEEQGFINSDDICS